MRLPLLPPDAGGCGRSACPGAGGRRAAAPRIIVTGEGESLDRARPRASVAQPSCARPRPRARRSTPTTTPWPAVISAMKAVGIADRDLQTAGIQISPRYNYTNKPDGSQEAELVAYQVTNTLSVRVRDLAKTGDILDKSVSLGVNQGGGISFTNDDPSAAVTEARKKAVADAIAKAKTLSEAAGVSLGRVLEISDQTYASPPMPISAKSLRRAPRLGAGAGRRELLQRPGQRHLRAQIGHLGLRVPGRWPERPTPPLPTGEGCRRAAAKVRCAASKNLLGRGEAWGSFAPVTGAPGSARVDRAAALVPKVTIETRSPNLRPATLIGAAVHVDDTGPAKPHVAPPCPARGPACRRGASRGHGRGRGPGLDRRGAPAGRRRCRRRHRRRRRVSLRPPKLR